MPGRKRKRVQFYAVVRGRVPGIYTSWRECESQVSGFSSALFKSFPTMEEADHYIMENTASSGVTNPAKRQKAQQTEQKYLPYFIDKSGDPETRAILQQALPIVPKYVDSVSNSPAPVNAEHNFPTVSLAPISINLISDSEEESTEEIIDQQPAEVPDKKISATESETALPLGADPLIFTYGKLGGDQRKVYDAVVACKESVFFTGSAGTGKSFLLKVIVNALGSSGLFITASTGIAAVHIGGQTLHSFAGIELGQGTFDDLLTKAYRKKKQWRECSTLIIDEISMISGKLFDQLEEIARVVRENEEPFGGIQLVISGDFFQLPPVNRKEKFAFQADTWDNCIQKTIELTQVYRQNENNFVTCLNEIRHGYCSIKSLNFLAQAEKPLIVEDGVLPTRLYCTNRSVDGENSKELSRIKEPEVLIVGLDREIHTIPEEKQAVVWPLLRRGQATALIKKEIVVKIGAQVMLLRNSSEHGLVNGSRGVVIDTMDITPGNWEELKYSWVNAENSKIDVCTIDYWYKNQLRLASENPKAFKHDENGHTIIQLPVVRFATGKTLRPVLPVTNGTMIEGQEYWYRIQVPLKLCWAVTIHKSQGMTLDRCQLNLSRVFEAGQAYVALSRLKSLKGLELRGFSQKCVYADRAVLEFYARKCHDPLAIHFLAQQDLMLLST